jgi:hypothetical protein
VIPASCTAAFADERQARRVCESSIKEYGMKRPQGRFRTAGDMHARLTYYEPVEVQLRTNGPGEIVNQKACRF